MGSWRLLITGLHTLGSPIETKCSLHSSVICFLSVNSLPLQANLFNFNGFMSFTNSTFDHFPCIFKVILVLFNLASMTVFFFGEYMVYDLPLLLPGRMLA